MTDYSGSNGADFSNLSVSNVRAILDCAGALTFRCVDVLEQAYSRHATGFGTILDFLLASGLISLSGQDVTLRPKLVRTIAAMRTAADPDAVVRSVCVEALLNGRSRFSRATYEYISRYRMADGALTYCPDSEERIATSALRNFLMDLDLVLLDKPSGCYTLEVETLSRVARSRSAVSPELLDSILKICVDVGASAERIVMQLETTRVSVIPGLASRIVHVAETDVNAGYDIESCETDKNDAGGYAPRFIEVKTYSARDPRFHWSINEVDTARLLRNMYWLYLVPRDDRGIFDIGDLQMIPDPCRLFDEPSGWHITAENYLFRRDT